MKMSGWKTDSVFRRYAIVATDDMVDAIEKQQAYVAREREAAKQIEAQNAIHCKTTAIGPESRNGLEGATSKPLE